MAALPTRCGRDGRGNTKKSHQFKPLADAWQLWSFGVEMPLGPRDKSALPSQHQGQTLTTQDHLCKRTAIIYGLHVSKNTWLLQNDQPPPPEPKPNEKMQNTPTHQTSHQLLCPLHTNSSLNTHPDKKRLGRRGSQAPHALCHSATRHISNPPPPPRPAYFLNRKTKCLQRGTKTRRKEQKKIKMPPTPSAMLFSFPAVQYPPLFASPSQHSRLSHHLCNTPIPLLTSPSEPNSTHTAPG